MDFDYYKIINRSDFESSGLVSQEIEVTMSGIGLRKILVTKGRLLSITYEGVMLSLELTTNPFIFDELSVLEDTLGDIYLGIAVT